MDFSGKNMKKVDFRVKNENKSGLKVDLSGFEISGAKIFIVEKSGFEW